MQKTIPPIKLILADDHEIFRDGFRAMIKKQPSVQLIGEAGDGEELIKICRDLKPDVVITDIKMPRMDGVEATKKVLLSSRPLTSTGSSRKSSTIPSSMQRPQN